MQDGGEALVEDAGSGWKGPETLGQQWPDLSSTAGWGGVQGVCPPMSRRGWALAEPAALCLLLPRRRDMGGGQ